MTMGELQADMQAGPYGAKVVRYSGLNPELIDLGAGGLRYSLLNSKVSKQTFSEIDYQRAENQQLMREIQWLRQNDAINRRSIDTANADALLASNLERAYSEIGMLQDKIENLQLLNEQLKKDKKG